MSNKIKVIKYDECGDYEIEKEITGVHLELGKKYCQCPDNWMQAIYEIVFVDDTIALGVSNKYNFNTYAIFNVNNGVLKDNPNILTFRLHELKKAGKQL